MALSALERLNIQRFVALSLNSATGAGHLEALGAVFENNGRDYQALARHIATTTQFRSIYSSGMNAADFCQIFLAGLGLTGNADAAAFLTARFNSGQKPVDIIFDSLVFLTNATGGALGQARDVVFNKALVSDYYSQTKGGASGDLLSMRNIVKDVDFSAASVVVAKQIIDGSPLIPVPTERPAPTVTKTLTKAAGEVITGGSSSDFFNATISQDASTSTLNINDLIDGGDNTDVLSITLSGRIDIQGVVPSAFTVKNVEVVNLIHTNDSGSGSSSLLNSATYSGVKELWQTDNDGNFSQFADVSLTSGVSAGFRSTGRPDAVSANVKIAQANVGQQTSVILEGMGDTRITFMSTGVKEITGSVAQGRSVSVSDATANTEIKVGLTSSGSLSVSSAALTTLDLSASTGGLSVELGFLNNLKTFKGGYGADNITMMTTKPTKSINIDLGAGNDTILVGGLAELTGSSQSWITLGAGSDTLSISALYNITDASPQNFQNGLIVVTDFDVRTDKLNFFGASRALTTAQLDSIKSESSLYAATQAAARIADGKRVVYSYGPDAYIFLDGGGSGLGQWDGLIKLVGVDATQLSPAAGNLIR
ncbi:hypothetical protein [uncultured Xylophilus sp.]|uniref:hypothetical protein n=1 Tax=uncultured Xylophilus sp. TaxID=296832 RepID=UPI0025CE5B67|nr:hypothetical protein [uncultured Xylophilus sp.]